MKLVANLDTIRDIISAITPVTSEILMRFDAGSISIDTVDDSNVCFIGMSIPSNIFKEYGFKEGTIALELKALEDKLSVGKKEDTITLEYDDKNKSINAAFGILKYKIKLIDPSAVKPLPKLPKFEFPSNFFIDGARFADLVKAALKVGDEARLITKDGKFLIEAKSSIESFESLNEDLKIEGDASSRFGLKYFDQIGNTLRKSSNIKVEIGNDYPIRLTMSINGIDLFYLIAPRMVDND